MIFCGLGNRIFEQSFENIYKRLNQVIEYQKDFSRWYPQREKLASEDIINELRYLEQLKFTGIYVVRPVLIRIYQAVYGFSLGLPEYPAILFRQNH